MDNFYLGFQKAEMSEKVELSARQHALTNIEEEIEIILDTTPAHLDEIRSLIIQAWLGGFLKEDACRRLIKKFNSIQSRSSRDDKRST